MDDKETKINVEELDLGDLLSDDIITINLNDTYGTTTTYWTGDNITDINVTDYDGTFTISDSLDSTIDISDWLGKSTDISPNEVERMCKEYPALEKVWRNFKSVYDMCKQDYEGKKKAGELDDDIPF